MGSTLTFAAAVLLEREPELILSPPPPPLTASFVSSPKLVPALEHPLQEDSASTKSTSSKSSNSSSSPPTAPLPATTSIDEGAQTEPQHESSSPETKAGSDRASQHSGGDSVPKKICRICWDGSGELVGTGCQCLDSFLHTECLLKWVEVNKRKEKVVCEICLGRYQGPFDAVLNEKLTAGLRKRLAELEREREFSLSRTMSNHPRMSKAVLAVAACLVVFAVVLITTFMLTRKKEDGDGD